MKKLILFLTMAAMATTISAEDKVPLVWPQFRGPGGSGIAENQKPPVEIGPDKNVKWKIAVPSGQSSPIIVGDKIVITTFDDGKLATMAINRADGSEAWDIEAPATKIESYFKAQGSPANSTCATDGKRIVSYFGSCGLFCYDLAGHELWRYEMPPAQTIAGFGTGNSPVIVDGLVILDREETKDPKIIAIDIATGEPKWGKKRESVSGFSTPAVWETPGGKQIAVPGFKRMIGYNIANGNEVWHVDGMPSACCTTPVAADGNLFFAGWSPGDPQDQEFKMPTFDEILKQNDADNDGVVTKEEAQKTDLKNYFDIQDANKDGKLTREEWDRLLKFSSASRNSAFALKPGASGDASGSVIWKQVKGLPYVSSAILYRGQYVMVKDPGIVTAYDAKTGEQLYQSRPVASGSYYASPVAANGNIYFISLADGAVTVIEGGSKPPKVVAKNPPLGERTAATPAIADDTLYIRTDGHLYAFGPNK
jgi:outer membrane protein assembly factor BamB